MPIRMRWLRSMPSLREKGGIGLDVSIACPETYRFDSPTHQQLSKINLCCRRPACISRRGGRTRQLQC